MALLGSLRPLGSLAPFGSLGQVATPAHSPSNLREAIYWLLSRDVALKALVGDRVHPNGLPQNPTYPAVATLFIGGFDNRNYDGRSHGTNRLRVTCWAESPEDLTELTGAVKSLLTDYRGLVGTVYLADVWLANEVDLMVTPGGGSDKWLCQTSLDFQIQSI